jgi:hypothetical protein
MAAVAAQSLRPHSLSLPKELRIIEFSRGFPFLPLSVNLHPFRKLRDEYDKLEGALRRLGVDPESVVGVGGGRGGEDDDEDVDDQEDERRRSLRLDLVHDRGRMLDILEEVG